MNFARWLILFSVISLWIGLHISQAASAGSNSPYQAIVERNVFGLVPIPTGPPPGAESPAALPKITPNGMMTLFGKLQVLFKVAVPGQPAGKEESYVMSEGDRQDDIEVQKIDKQSATITFNNHGTIQTLALVEGKATGGATPPAVGGPGGVPRLPVVPGRPAGGGAATPIGFGGHFGHPQNDTASAGANSGGPGFGGASEGGVNAQNQEPPMSPEAQVIMIEANRMVTQDAVNQGEAPPLPPTEMTPSDATGIGGAPLVLPSGNGSDKGTPGSPGGP